MIKKIMNAAVVLLAGLLIYAAVQPADYNISREVTINASAEKIFPYLNNPQLMQAWAPWKEMDPNVVMSFAGPTEGIDAKTTWQSPGEMGEGAATVIESIPNQSVKTKLEYFKPMAMQQVADMTVTASGAASLVKWSVQGKNDLISRFVCLFMDIDKLVGGNFEKGLAKLKAIIEQSPQ